MAFRIESWYQKPYKALCFGETLSTLKFAARAKHIRCTVQPLQSVNSFVDCVSTGGRVW